MEKFKSPSAIDIIVEYLQKNNLRRATYEDIMRLNEGETIYIGVRFSLFPQPFTVYEVCGLKCILRGTAYVNIENGWNYGIYVKEE